MLVRSWSALSRSISIFGLVAVSVPAIGATVQPLEVDVDGLEVGAFCSLVFRDIEHVHFSLSPDVYGDHRPIAVHLRGPRADFHSSVVHYLETLGYAVEDRGGVYVVAPKPPQADRPELPKDTFVYRPRFRDAAYLIDQIRGAVPGVTYGNERQVRQSQQAFPVSGSLTNIAQPVSGQQAATASVPPSTSAAGMVDSGADVVVATGHAEDLSRVRELLGQLDRIVGEVVVRATVFEVQVTNQDTGAFQLAAKVLGGKFAVSYGSSVDASIPNTISVGSSSLQAVVGALAQDTHFKSLSSSQSRVQSGKSASFTAGEADPVLGAVTYQGATGQPVQSVQYMNAGVILDVKPHVYEDVIALDLHQEVSSFQNTTTGVNNSPTIIKRAVDSTLSMVSGEVVLLGGLVADQGTKNRSGLSFLPRWLDSTSDDNTRREIIVVLQVDRAVVGAGLRHI